MICQDALSCPHEGRLSASITRTGETITELWVYVLHFLHAFDLYKRQLKALSNIHGLRWSSLVFTARHYTLQQVTAVTTRVYLFGLWIGLINPLLFFWKLYFQNLKEASREGFFCLRNSIFEEGNFVNILVFIEVLKY